MDFVLLGFVFCRKASVKLERLLNFVYKFRLLLIRFLEKTLMARVCKVTGKRPMVGNHVSHANNKTKRRFLPNLHYRRFWVESENRWVRLRVSNAALRTIDKNGIDAVLADLRARGEI